MTGRRWLGQRYDLAHESGDPSGFFGRILQGMNISVGIRDADLARIPRTGPALLIANHPFGVVDGLALCHLAARARGSFKMLLHQGLCRDPRLEPFMLPVDPSDDDVARRTNRRSVKAALEELRGGGTLLLFPVGEISTAVALQGPVADMAWHPTVAKILRKSAATVVPIHYRGTNSALFQAVSQFSPTLRAAVLLREVKARRGQPVQLRIGLPIRWSVDLASRTDEQLVSDLRRAVYSLSPPAALPRWSGHPSSRAHRRAGSRPRR